MHELGIIVNINKTLAEVAADNGVSRISRVTLELGEVSGIVPELLEDCGARYETVRFGRQCPQCGSGRTYLLKGNECNIKEIEAC